MNADSVNFPKGWRWVFSFLASALRAPIHHWDASGHAGRTTSEPPPDTVSTRELLQAVIDRDPNYIFVKDAQGRYVLTNAAVSTLWRVPPTGMLGKTDAELAALNHIPADQATIFEEEDARVRSEHRMYVWREQRVMLPEGKVLWCQMYKTPLSVPGMTGAVLGVGVDITEQRQISESLREREQLLHSIFENAALGIVLTDLDGTLTLVNPTLLNLLGYPREEIEGRHYLCTTHPSDDTAELLLFRELIRGHREYGQVEKRLMRKDGQYVWVRVTMSLVKHGERAIGCIGVVEDIDARRRADQERARYQQALRELSLKITSAEEKERRALAQDLHDCIGQPLAMAKVRLGMFGARLRDPSHAAELAEIRKQLDEAIDASRSLTFQLSPPVLHELGLGPALESLAEQFEKQHNLDVHVEDKLDEQGLPADLKVMLYRAARELLINVVKHARAGHAWIAAHTADGEVVLEATDDGVGMAVASANFEAAGCGLFYMRERVEHYGGTMTINSQPGAGTRVHLQVPIAGSGTRAKQ